MNRAFAIGIIAALAIGGFGPSALAHAYLVEAKPPIGSVVKEPPKRLRLTFTEAIEPRLSTFVLYDATGTPIAEPPVSLDEEGRRVTLPLPRELEPDVYTLAWKVLSAIDGHVTQGVYPFGVGSTVEPVPEVEGGEGPPSPLRLVVRGLRFLGAMALVGGLFLLLLLRDILEASRLTPPLRRVLWGSWGLLLGASLTNLLFQALSIKDVSLLGLFTQGVLAQLLFQTRYGFVWMGRLALVLALVPLLLLTPTRGGPPRWAAALGALMLLGFSLSGHSAALAEGAPLAILADWVHLLAASLWVGGLLQLAFLLTTLRRLEVGERQRVTAALRARFYPWALISASALLLTGFHLTYRHLPDLGEIGMTAYGRTYLAKHLLLVPLVALAALNLLRVVKAARWVGLEALVAVAVVFFAGTLTLLPPAGWPQPGAGEAAAAVGSHEKDQPLLFLHPAGELVIALGVRSNKAGPNAFDVYVTDSQGHPVEDVLRVWLVFVYQERGLGEVTAVAQPRGDGRYRVEGSYLSLAGEWKITVWVRLKGRAEDLKAEFSLKVE